MALPLIEFSSQQSGAAMTAGSSYTFRGGISSGRSNDALSLKYRSLGLIQHVESRLDTRDFE